MRKIILTIILLLFAQTALSDSIFDDLKKSKKTSYLDFILLKIEQRLILRHSLLGAQVMAMRIQYQSVGSQVDFSEKESKLETSPAILSAIPPWDVIVSCTIFSLSAFRAIKIILAPQLESRVAIASPMPLEAPVTIATFSLKL